MTERRRRLPHSIFLKLLAVMLGMAVSLLFLVGGFFALVVMRDLGQAVPRVIGAYARTVAASGPDLAGARALAARAGVEVRYEGPDGSWTTSPDLPSIAEVSGGAGPRSDDYYLARGPGGGTYLFVWGFHRRMAALHTQMLVLLLTLIVTVVFLAHAVLKRALRPLRTLYDGVLQLSEGDLGIVLPPAGRDELGVLTDAFNDMVRRVKEMLRARDQLLLDVSHELRSPLTRMKVALELLPDSDKRRRLGADIAEMEAMLKELIELERFRDGGGVRTERMNVVPLLREAADAFREVPPGVRVACEAEEILLDVDPDRFRAVLRNLLENAVKYSLPDSREVQLSATSTARTVVVRVKDDGRGIPEADLPRVFEPFYRVDPSRSKKTGGYGLGLSICQRITEAHGGAIVAENNADRGASFTLTFPRS